MKYVHTILNRKNELGNKVILETWLPEDSRVKWGSKISLKGQTEIWTVVNQGDPTELPESAKKNSKTWHDNDNHRRLGKLHISE